MVKKITEGRSIVLDLTRPLAHARELLELSQGEAATRLGLDRTKAGDRSQVSKMEIRGAEVLLSTLVRVLGKLGFDVELRVTRRS
jgi:transcriptional regulator with XRE-family HTH domain